ncbi:beta-propeller domain-containing protein [Paenibacillus flagellatus]|uniref:Copper amine oxidase-like N-terminal domain-containing protein n=1 Tax=Paenibacillus flagellatus TaxID=2211139 RepID=A0A2V5K1W2_9BACL|nr:beta-propeller domain-containing protein [Paenibacillus flagellatus]PYI52622.1 hypothetical protein DLM86_20870 [Paenibacillus flagellatus]
MKKIGLTGLLALALIASFAPGKMSTPPVLAADGEEGEPIRITLFGEPFSGQRPPVLVDGVALVPLRDIAEALGAEVSWDDRAQSATLRKDDAEIRLDVGSDEAVKNGRTIRLDAAPRLIDDVTMVPLRFIGESFDALVIWNGETRTAAIDRLQSLPAVGSYANLKTLLEQAGGMAYGAQIDFLAKTEGPMPATADSASTGVQAERTEAPAPPTASKDKASYSQTNTQVEGVDEADVVKTDGTYLYQVNRERIVITKAVPSAEMSVASVIGFEDRSFRPNELYVDDKHLIVIGRTNGYASAAESGSAAVSGSPAVRAEKRIAPIVPMSASVKAIVYDIADKTSPKRLREVELDGDYVSSRKIGSAVYLIANRYAGIVRAMPYGSDTAADGDEAKANAPFYRDSAVSERTQPIDYKDIRYFPDFTDASYMLIGGIDLDRPDRPMDVAAYLGSGRNVYASERNLYVSVTKHEPLEVEPLPAENGGVAADQAAPGSDALAKSKRVAPPRFEQKTVVYKFRLDQGKTTFITQGEVPGTVLNQFSMDEHNGIFRIATTKGDMWRTDENTSKNNVYTLDEALKPLGKLEGVAPGERIYSVRFMGNRAYMVTFKNTDPLFALDLSNPAAPAILGALKIPGYSDYLHPYDETHLIGFGKETAEIPVKGDPSAPDRTVAYYQGMKVSLFDVTDVSKPVEKFKEVIGDRGTESELLHNHKALLFSKDRSLLAFPVTVAEIPNKTSGSPDSVMSHGQFTFQGAYVYRLDLTNGFDRKAAITHMTDEERLKAGSGWYDSDRNVERILYIGDTLYTLSRGMIKANDLHSMKETGSLPLP